MKSKISGLLAVALLAGPMAANALIITISGQGSADGQWDVTTTSLGHYDELLPTLDDQVWWSDGTLALAFAVALGAGLGLPNDGVVGPKFAYAEDDSDVDFFLGCAFTNDIVAVTCGPVGYRHHRDFLDVFATASRVHSVPESGSLALLGLGLLGLGGVRRRAA